MSDLRVTNLKGRTAGSSPTLPDGAVISGITTVTTLEASTDVKIANKSVATTGKAIAMAMVFG
jgi:hypothetical protein